VKEYTIVLKLVVDETQTVPPDDGWNWDELLDLGGNEEVEVVLVKENVRAYDAE
jgi:hypothetical protein